jgi:uncharacterized protein
MNTPVLLTPTAIDDPAYQSPDCACPDTSFETYEPVVPDTQYVIAPELSSQSLPGDFRLLDCPTMPVTPCVVNHEGWRALVAFDGDGEVLTGEFPIRLAQHGILVPSQGIACRPIIRQETLTAWLHVSNACNLECPYCYVRKSSQHMSMAVGIAAVNNILSAAKTMGFSKIKLKYAGGEAALNFALVKRLHTQAFAQAQDLDLSLAEVLLSNGTVVPSGFVSWLNESAVRLMISLDGIGARHDRQRPFKNRRGSSFEIAEQNIDRVFLPNGIRPTICVTVTKQNALGLADTVAWAIDRDLPFLLNFYRQNQQSQSRHELNLEEQSIIEGLLAAYRVIEVRLPIYPFANGLLDRVQNQAHTHTCGVSKSYIVIAHDGKLAQCQMHLHQAVGHELGLAALSTVMNGTQIHNLSVDDKEGCRHCLYRYRCSGGCPIETYRATGRWDVKSPNCHIYKSLLPTVQRLEGLRLMKVAGYLN